MDNLLTTRQVQDRLKVDRITIYRMLQDGRLRGVKIGQQWRFPEKEIERLKKEQERLAKEIARCQGMLSNPNFVNKAPEAKVNAEKEKLQKYEEMMEKVKIQLTQMDK